MPDSAAACVPPVQDATLSPRQNDNFPAVTRAQMDLVHLAQACDLTRVSTVQISREAADPRFTWLGINRGHHAISHDEDTNAESRAQLVAINRWFAEQFAYLVGKLAGTQEGASRQIDNTVMIWVNGLAKGNIHSHDPQSTVLAGRASGAIETGRFLQIRDRTPTNALYVSILNAFGIPASSFGSFGNGPLAGLLTT